MSKYILSYLSPIVIIALVLLQTGCDNTIKNHFDAIYTSEVYEGLAYDLSSPESTINLPPVLNEISGLSYLDEKTVIAIQDEVAVVYLVNLEDGSIGHQLKFSSRGDYEGVALVDNTVHVISSDGQLFRFELSRELKEIKSTKIETSLTQRNDVEGLTYDKKNNRLLIACKGKGEVGQNQAKGKCLYAFDLNTSQLNIEPISSIRKKEIESIITSDYSTMKLKGGIGPSGVAIHPVSGQTYMIAHDGKALIILDSSGQLDKYIPLNPALFPQPEGICFNQKGDLFISNEASFSLPNIMKFPYRL